MVPWEFRNRVVVVDLDNKVLERIMRKKRILRRKLCKLNENRTSVRFEKE